MTVGDRYEAERLLRKYDVKTLAPLAVNCGMIRLLKEREEEVKQEQRKKQMNFNFDGNGNGI